jgi:hypothetical protein
LEECSSENKLGYDANSTVYARQKKIKCSCVPERFICGEDGSIGLSFGFFVDGVFDVIDISDFLKEGIKGPVSFRCDTRSGCTFEEPAMNKLINSFFGNSYNTTMSRQSMSSLFPSTRLRRPSSFLH